MKLKNIQSPLLVLFVLIVASFAFFAIAQEQATTAKSIFLDSDQDGLSDAEEKTYGTDPQIADTDGDGYSDGTEINAGYDPLKAATVSGGDKLSPTNNLSAPIAVTESSAPNLTDTLTQKITTLTNDIDPNNPTIAIDQIKTLVSDSLSAQDTDLILPEIPDDTIKIKKQNYKSLSTEKAAAKMKEDFTNYISGLLYILSSNSPAPITSASDINTFASSTAGQITQALVTKDGSSLKNLGASGKKTLEQLKTLEVPEELIEMHKRGLQLAQYSAELQNKTLSSTQDPIADIINYSRMQNLITLTMTYTEDIQAKIDQYGLAYDDTVKNKLQNYGIVIPNDLTKTVTP